MFQKTKRESLVNQNYHPPVGYYDQKISSTGRMIDFGEKPINKPRLQYSVEMPGPGAYLAKNKVIFPTIAINQPLHGYARPKDRVLWNKKVMLHRQQLKEQNRQDDEVEQKPNVYSYNIPKLEVVKPRVLGCTIQPNNQRNEMNFNQLTEEIDPLFDEVLMGQQVQLNLKIDTTKLNCNQKLCSKNLLKEYDIPMDERSSQIFGDQSTLMQSELQEYKEQIKEKISQQRVFKKKKHHSNISQDYLEAYFLRDKMKADNNIPGPGSYFDSEKQSSFRLQKIPAQFQCFSSMVSRFRPQEEEQQFEETNEDYIEERQRLPQGMKFSRMIGRSERKSEQMPGVGDYAIQSSNFRTKQQEFVKYPSAFGSGLKRF